MAVYSGVDSLHHLFQRRRIRRDKLHGQKGRQVFLLLQHHLHGSERDPEFHPDPSLFPVGMRSFHLPLLPDPVPFPRLLRPKVREVHKYGQAFRASVH